jgi:oxalate decarboxylase
MNNGRRNFLGTAALGVGGLVALTNGASATDVHTDHGKAGDGGFGLQANQLPPGATVAYHDPEDVQAMPDRHRKSPRADGPRSPPSTSCRS